MKQREIKFRAWDKKNKIMIEEDSVFNLCIYNGDIGSGFHLENEEGIQIEGDFILQQYTGLKDKNGKMIFEGDIVKGYFNEKDVEDWVWLTLSENEKRTGIKIFEIEIPDVFQHAMPYEIEVIGNIFENKNLIKELK